MTGKLIRSIDECNEETILVPFGIVDKRSLIVTDVLDDCVLVSPLAPPLSQPASGWRAMGNELFSWNGYGEKFGYTEGNKDDYKGWNFVKIHELK